MTSSCGLSSLRREDVPPWHLHLGCSAACRLSLSWQVSERAPCVPGMAPVPLQRTPPSPRLHHYHHTQPATGSTRLARSVKNLLSLKVVLYVLLATAAVFGAVVLCWKLGSLVRQFTRGRVLQSKKSFRTRYIKTWYGWVPQHRYNSQRRAWKRALGRPWTWFSWSHSSDDYSWVWWDSSCAKSENATKSDSRRALPKLHRKDEYSRPNSGPSLLPADDQLAPSSKQAFGACPLGTTGFPILDSFSASPSVVATRKHIPDTRMSLHYSISLTYPLHLKPPRSGSDAIRLSESDIVPQRPRPNPQWTCLTRADPYRITAWRRRRRRRASGQRSKLLFPGTNRRAKRLRKWAVSMQIHSPRSMLPYQGSLNGCPGSPGSEFLSRCSDRQRSLQQFNQNKAPLGKTKKQSPHYPGNFAMDRNAKPDWILVIHDEAPLRRDCNVTVASTTEKTEHKQKTSRKHMSVDSLTDGEVLFLDGLDRRLEWLLGECQPGRRGFRFPILPRNCLSKRPPIVYIYPCCASVDLMRLHGDSTKPAESTRNQSNDKVLTMVSQERPNATHTRARIDSWRTQINKWRRFREMEELKSTGKCGSSAEEPPNNVIDPSSWILRRPPQGFPMSTKQKNAYYCCEAGRWGKKVEDWQLIDK